MFIATELWPSAASSSNYSRLGVESMLHRIRCAWVLGAIGLIGAGTAISASAGEYRVSALGKPVIRQATVKQTTYQTEEAEPTPAPKQATPRPLPLAPAPARQQPVLVEELPDSTVPYSWESETPGLGPQADCCSECWDESCEGGCGTGCFGWKYWGSFEFLMWWRKSQEMPPLVTTSPDGTDAAIAGVLGNPTTQILYPSDSPNSNARAGGRLTVGLWFDECETLGLGARLYSLGEATATFDADSDEYAILARPFYNLTLDEPDADVIVFPTFTTGSISVDNTSRVGGGDVFLRRWFCGDACRRFDLLIGYQFARIDSEVSVSSNRRSIRTEGSIPFGTVIQMTDLFDTTNSYHAGELGLLGEYDRGNITWSLLAKVGLGTMQQQTRISGSTTTAVPGQPVTTTNQGLLALGTNIGTYEQNAFTVSPELQLTAAYHLTSNLDLSVGYSFIYWNHVAQAGQQMDEILNTTQINGALVGAARPEFLNQDSSYYVQGLSVGLQWIW